VEEETGEPQFEAIPGKKGDPISTNKLGMVGAYHNPSY
jgi:hypothetical protein